MEQLYIDKVTETIILNGDSCRLSWTQIMIDWNDKFFFYKIYWGDKFSDVTSLYHCFYREVGNDNSWDTTTVFSWGTTTSHALQCSVDNAAADIGSCCPQGSPGFRSTLSLSSSTSEDRSKASSLWVR